ncbi:MAG: twin-arginine translocase TatA/TatE family subunit [Dethiobacteria bacterium]|jgi:sec-independent protein translocase protein TatA
MFGRLGWLEVVLIFGIILVIFGPGKLPGFSKALGQTIRNYKDGLSGKDSEKDTEEARKD